jgi:galactokinase/mevalonate kinase-like predicted kinase
MKAEDNQLFRNVKSRLKEISDIAYEYIIKNEEINVSYLAGLLAESHQEKILTPGYEIPHDVINTIDLLREAGVDGYKLVGAGGGGFMLAVLDHDQKLRLSRISPGISILPCKIDWEGVVSYESMTS